MILVAAAFALAYASTNLDNLAVLLALIPRAGLVRAAGAFILTQVLVIAAAVLVGAAAEGLPATWIGWLGLVPVAIGLNELRRDVLGGTADEAPRSTRNGGFAALALTFAGMSADTFALTAALLADSAERFDPAVLSGAGLALAALVLVAVATTRVAARASAVLARLDRITPFIMIASGCYILFNTYSDIV